MSVYDKIYLAIPPSAPLDEGEAYRLKNIDEFEQFLRDEVIKRDKLSKRYKQRQISVTIIHTSIFTAITCLCIGSVSTTATGVGMPISIALASIGLSLSLCSAIMHNTQRIFDKNRINIKESNRCQNPNSIQYQLFTARLIFLV